jgi:hypothetical protein
MREPVGIAACGMPFSRTQNAPVEVLFCQSTGVWKPAGLSLLVLIIRAELAQQQSMAVSIDRRTNEKAQQAL